MNNFFTSWFEMIVEILKTIPKILFYIFSYPVPLWFSTVLLCLLFYSVYRYQELKKELGAELDVS